MTYDQAAAFLLIVVSQWLFTRKVSRTFMVLFFASIVNVIANLLLVESDPFLVPIYAGIDAITFGVLCKHEDIQGLYQRTLLGCCVSVHLLCQFDADMGTSIVYNDYLVLLGAITILQILGGVLHGVVERKRTLNNGRDEFRLHSF